MANAIVNLQQVVSRDVDPTDPAVVTVGIVNGGTAIMSFPIWRILGHGPESQWRELRKRLREAMQRRCAASRPPHGCELNFIWEDGYPPTTNDAAMADYVSRIARKTLVEDKFISTRVRRWWGGFFVLPGKNSGVFFFIGVEPADVDGYPSLHSDKYVLRTERFRWRCGCLGRL